MVLDNEHDTYCILTNCRSRQTRRKKSIIKAQDLLTAFEISVFNVSPANHHRRSQRDVRNCDFSEDCEMLKDCRLIRSFPLCGARGMFDKSVHSVTFIICSAAASYCSVALPHITVRGTLYHSVSQYRPPQCKTQSRALPP